jgi:hypothetical protein
MQRFAPLFAALLLLGAGAIGRAAPAIPVEVRFLPCPIKQHLVEADWWACTASPSLPVYVFGAYETRVPIFFAHVYLQMPRNLRPPAVVWSDERGRVSFSSQDTYNGPAAAVAAPGYQILTPALDGAHNERSGKTTIVAKLSGSIKRTLRFPAIVYKTLSVGCYGFARAPGLTFSIGDRSTVAATPADADLYVTGPAGPGAAGEPGPGYGCKTPFADTSGDYVLHFPGGGTTIQTTRFHQLTAKQWKNDITSISLVDVKNNALIFKTKNGTIVKALIFEVAQGRIGGVYETTTTSGEFTY